jgi:hypothetical protein
MALVLAACDPGYTFWLRNQSKSTVIIQFIDVSHSGTGFLLRPGQASQGFGGLGSAWAGHVQVVEETCSVIWEGDINASSGGVEVAVDGSVRFVAGMPGDQPGPTMDLPLHLASETGTCLPAGVGFSKQNE